MSSISDMLAQSINGVTKGALHKNTGFSLSSFLNPVSAVTDFATDLFGFGYNIFANERANKQQQKLNQQQQYNFENQFQIGAKDLERAGFNPSAIIGGANQNSAPSMSASSFNAVNGTNALESLVQMKLADSQVKMNDAEVERIKAETNSINDEWRNRDTRQKRELENALSVAGLSSDAVKYSADLNSTTQKYIADQNSKTQKIIAKNANKLTYIMHQNQRFDNIFTQSSQANLALEMAVLAHQYKISEIVIEKEFGNIISQLALAGNDILNSDYITKHLQGAFNSLSKGDKDLHSRITKMFKTFIEKNISSTNSSDSEFEWSDE